MTETAAPAATISRYIAPETGYAGRYQTTKRSADHGVTWRMGLASAAEMAAQHTYGEPFTIWTCSGTLRDGVHLFTRERVLAQADGSLATYATDGRLVLVRPAGRDFRYLGRA